jgi:hypothetical protein
LPVLRTSTSIRSSATSAKSLSKLAIGDAD